MSRYQAYPEYQHSGIAWLGETPTSWTVAPLKWFIDRNDGGVWGGDPDGENDTLVLRSTEQTVDGLWKMDDPAPRKLSASDKNFALLRSGDLVVTTSSGSSLHIGKTTIVNDDIERLECCYSNFMQRIRTSRLLLPRLAWYVMNNELSRAQFDFLSNSTTGLANLNGTMIGQIFLAIPSEVEQQAIINFLDYETAKIDALIEKQQRLIELLKEKRQAVISQAVTKGLNPNAPMKDSGVEWAGRVPAHWHVSKLGYHASVYNGATPNRENMLFWENGTIGWLNSSKVNDELIKEADHFITNLAFSKTSVKPVNKGNLVMAITGEGQTRGRVAICNIEATINQHLAAISIRDKLLQYKFLYLWLEGNYERIRYESEGAGSTKGAITCSEISAFPVILPPLEEQAQIVNYVAERKCKFDGLIGKAVSAIELMQERRTALISAAVTGKIDVRDWQAAA